MRTAVPRLISTPDRLQPRRRSPGVILLPSRLPQRGPPYWSATCMSFFRPRPNNGTGGPG